MKINICMGILFALAAIAPAEATERWSTLEVSGNSVRIIAGDKSISGTSSVNYSSLNVKLKFKKAVKWYQFMVGNASGEMDCTLVEWRAPHLSNDRKIVEFEIFPGAGGCKKEVYARWED